MSIRLGILASEFNSDITAAMLEKARVYAEKLNCKVTYICKVPGAFDIPLMLQYLLEKTDVDAIATIGAIVKGETDHDQVIGYEVASRISELSMRFKKPVAFGVSGPGMTREQALARVDEYAERSVRAAVEMARRINLLANSKPSEYPLVVD